MSYTKLALIKAVETQGTTQHKLAAIDDGSVKWAAAWLHSVFLPGDKLWDHPFSINLLINMAVTWPVLRTHYQGDK